MQTRPCGPVTVPPTGCGHLNPHCAGTTLLATAQLFLAVVATRTWTCPNLFAQNCLGRRLYLMGARAGTWWGCCCCCLLTAPCKRPLPAAACAQNTHPKGKHVGWSMSARQMQVNESSECCLHLTPPSLQQFNRRVSLGMETRMKHNENRQGSQRAGQIQPCTTSLHYD